MAKQRDFPSAIQKLITEAERNKDVDKYEQAIDIALRTIKSFEYKEGTIRYRKSRVYRHWVDNTKNYWDELYLRLLTARAALKAKLDMTSWEEFYGTN